MDENLKPIYIWIPGQPSRTTHQSGTKISGHRTYKTASLVRWEHTLQRGLMKHVPDKPIDGPVKLTATWGFKAPISGHRTYKTASLVRWEHTLQRGLMKHVPDKPIDGPVKLTATWGFKAPKKSDVGWKLTRPDTDNMQKTLKDVMTRMNFWEDDSQVVHEVCRKIWTLDPGIYLKIEKLDSEDWRKEC